MSKLDFFCVQAKRKGSNYCRWESRDGTYMIVEYDYEGNGLAYKAKHHFHAYKHGMHVSLDPREQSYPTHKAARHACEEDYCTNK